MRTAERWRHTGYQLYSALDEGHRLMLRFGEFELDLPKAELRRGRQPVPIQPRVFRLLTHLVMNRHRVVTQDELLDTVWARESVVPSVLSTAVRALRRTLGDDSRQPRYVQTVHRVGYGFIGRVDDAPEADEAARAVSPIQWARHVAFVGREAETRSFLQGVANPQSHQQLLWVTGAAGVGKTTLLEELVCQCAVAGHRAITLRAEELVPRPDALARALTRALGLPDRGDSFGELSGCPFTVLFIDGYDLLAGVDEWLHGSLWPVLPSHLRLVLASRSEPAARWRCDSAWSQAATHLELTPFGEDGAREFLQRRAVDAQHFERVWEFTHGHPLALALVVDALRRSRGAFEPSQRLGVIDALVAWFVDRLPSRQHLHALQAACLMGRVSQRSLAALLDEGADAEEFFEWLEGLSFVAPVANGVRVHDLVRESVLAQLSARNSEPTQPCLEAALRPRLPEPMNAPTLPPPSWAKRPPKVRVEPAVDRSDHGLHHFGLVGASPERQTERATATDFSAWGARRARARKRSPVRQRPGRRPLDRGGASVNDSVDRRRLLRLGPRCAPDRPACWPGWSAFGPQQRCLGVRRFRLAPRLSLRAVVEPSRLRRWLAGSCPCNRPGVARQAGERRGDVPFDCAST